MRVGIDVGYRHPHNAASFGLEWGRAYGVVRERGLKGLQMESSNDNEEYR